MKRPDDLLQQAITLATALPAEAARRFQRAKAGDWSSFATNSGREALLLQVRDIYDGATRHHREKMGSEQPFEALNRAGRLPFSPMRQWIEKLCGTYQSEPSREFHYQGEPVEEGTPQEATALLLKERYEQADVDAVLAETDADLFLQWAKVLIPFYDAANDELLIHEYTAPSIRVVENRDNPKRPFAVVLMGGETASDDAGKAKTTPFAHIWINNDDGTSMLYVLRNGAVAAEITRNARAPVVHCFDGRPSNNKGYWQIPRGLPLAEAVQIFANDHFDMLGEAMLMQMFGIGQVFNPPKGELKISPKSWIEFDGSPDQRQGIEFANANPMLGETLDVIREMVADLRRNHGIPDAVFENEGALSGAAISKASGPLREVRKSRLKLFVPIENQLLRRIGEELRVSGVDGFTDFNADDWSVHVTFAESEEDWTTQDQIAMESHELAIGIVTPVDLLMRRRPDLTRAEAEAMLEPEEEPEPEPETEIVVANEEQPDV